MADAAGRPIQLSLFPDEFEVQAAAVAALRDLDLARARALLARVRRSNARLVNVGVIDAALTLLESVLRATPPDAGELARAFTAAESTWRAGQLSKASADFADGVVAAYWRRHGGDATFLDAGATVHRGLVDLLMGDPRAARHHLRVSLEADCAHRADLWSYLGDASVALERTAEAGACYVRALLLGAGDVDFLRLRHPQLGALYTELRQSDACARELVFVYAWLRRILDVPRENGWLVDHAVRIEGETRLEPAAFTDGGDAPSAEAGKTRLGGHEPEVSARRLRRFAWLLYCDCSTRRGAVVVARREEMAELEPELFREVMREYEARETQNR